MLQGIQAGNDLGQPDQRLAGYEQGHLRVGGMAERCSTTRSRLGAGLGQGHKDDPIPVLPSFEVPKPHVGGVEFSRCHWQHLRPPWDGVASFTGDPLHL